MARTDALQQQGLEAAIERALACEAAGADAIFAEAVYTLEQYQAFTKVTESASAWPISPSLAKRHSLTKQSWLAVGVDMVLYPLSAFRAMNKAALNVYRVYLWPMAIKKL